MKKLTVIIFIVVVATGAIGCLSLSSFPSREADTAQRTEQANTTVLNDKDKPLVFEHVNKEEDAGKNVNQTTLDAPGVLQIANTLLSSIYNNEEINFSDEKALLKYLKATNDEEVYLHIIEKLQAAVAGNESDDRLVEYSLSLLAAVDSLRASEVFFTFIGRAEWEGSSAIYIVNKSISKLTRNGDYTALVQQTFTQANDDNPFVRELSSAIARHATTEQVDYLISFVDSPSKNKSMGASQAMNSIHKESLVPHITSYITSSSTKTVQSTALHSLANMGQYEAVSALIAWSAKQPKESIDQVEQLFTIALSRSPSAKRSIEKEINSQEFANENVKVLIIKMSNEGLD